MENRNEPSMGLLDDWVPPSNLIFTFECLAWIKSVSEETKVEA